MKKTFFLIASLFAMTLCFVSCEENVTLNETVWTEPYLGWGESPSKVSSKMNAKGFSLVSEQTEGQIYGAKKRADMTMTFFTNSKYTSAAVLVDTDAVEAKAIYDQLYDNYTDIEDADEDYDLFLTKDEETVVSYSVEIVGDDVYWFIAYVPYSSNYSALVQQHKAAFRKQIAQ